MKRLYKKLVILLAFILIGSGVIANRVKAAGASSHTKAPLTTSNKA